MNNLSCKTLLRRLSGIDLMKKRGLDALMKCIPILIVIYFISLDQLCAIRCFLDNYKHGNIDNVYFLPFLEVIHILFYIFPCIFIYMSHILPLMIRVLNS